MAMTEFTTSHALRVERWSAIMFQYPRFKSYFSKFIGPNVKLKGVDLATSANAMVQLKADFSKEKGDKVTFGMTAPLRNAGVPADGNLEGEEEEMTFYDWYIELKKTRNGVKGAGTLSDKRVKFNVKTEAREQLGPWLGHRIDNYTACALAGIASDDGNVAVNAPSNGNRKWVGGQNSTDTLTHCSGDLDANFGTATSELFGTKVIETVRRKASVTEPVLRPIIINGKEWFVMFIHPYQAKALKASTAWKNGALYADVRGEKNRLFQGALGSWDGVVLHEYSKIETRLGTSGGTEASSYFDSADPVANTKYAARALFCGAQAVCQAYGQLPYYRAKDFDYADKWGVSVGVMVGIGKPEFNSEDYGVIVVDTQYVAD